MVYWVVTLMNQLHMFTPIKAKPDKQQARETVIPVTTVTLPPVSRTCRSLVLPLLQGKDVWWVL